MSNTSDKLEDIVAFVDTWESTEKSDFIKDLLIMLGDDNTDEIWDKLRNHQPILGGD